MELAGKTALITGGARIGAEVARQLAQKGCDIVLTYKSSVESARKTAQEIKKKDARALIIKADLTKPSDIKNLFKNIRKEFGRLDILINMVSIYEKTPLSTLTDKQWDAIVNSNFKTAHLLVQHARQEISFKQGRIIHISDWVAASGRPRYKNYLPYYAAKSGLIGLMQAQALELAPKVLVNAIAPGPILPPASIKNEEVRNIASVTPLGRWGGAVEIAKAVLFLCDSDFVTGECIRVDGGRHLF